MARSIRVVKSCSPCIPHGLSFFSQRTMSCQPVKSRDAYFLVYKKIFFRSNKFRAVLQQLLLILNLAFPASVYKEKERQPRDDTARCYVFHHTARVTPVNRTRHKLQIIWQAKLSNQQAQTTNTSKITGSYDSGFILYPAFILFYRYD